MQFKNCTTPLVAVEVLKLFFEKKILSKSSFDFLWKLMIDTKTGFGRLKGLLPFDTVVAHKTGYSGIDKNGIIAACNDIGIIRLPNGDHFGIAVFVSDLENNLEQAEAIIAEIAKVVWDFTIS